MSDINRMFTAPKGKNTFFEIIKSPRNIVFYPFFYFRPGFRKNPFTDLEEEFFYKLEFWLNDFTLTKLQNFEIRQGRYDIYNCFGFWSIKRKSKIAIGLSVQSLEESLKSFDNSEINYVKCMNSSILFIFKSKKTRGSLDKWKLEVYISTVNDVPYVDSLNSILYCLEKSDIIKKNKKINRIDAVPKHITYYYSKNNKKHQSFENTIPFYHPWQNLLEYIKNSVLEKSPISPLPRFTLIKNPILLPKTMISQLSHFLCWRTGGGFDDNDFNKKTKFRLSEIESHEFGDLNILDVPIITKQKYSD